MIMNNYFSLDLGSQNIKIILLSHSEKDNSFKILAKNSYPSSGISFGYITNQEELVNSLKKAVLKFEKEHQIKIESAFFSLDGHGIKSQKIFVNYQVASGSISEYDMEKIEEKSRSLFKKSNQDFVIEEKIIKYIVDGFEHFSSPLNLNAKKVTAEYLFITKPKNNFTLLENSISKTGIFPISFSSAMLSSAQSSLSELDRKLGSALVDIGAQKTSILIYENNYPLYYNTIKYGSENITKKISLSEQIDFTKADRLKKGQAFPKKIDKIISSELQILAKKILNEVKKAERENILPGGVTLIGGGSKIFNIEKIFKKELSLPVKKSPKNITDFLTDYHIAYGVAVSGIKDEHRNNTFHLPNFKKILKIPKNIIKKIIP